MIALDSFFVGDEWTCSYGNFMYTFEILRTFVHLVKLR